MRWAFEGGTIGTAKLPPELRDYMIVRLGLARTPAEIEELPATWVDWMLGIDAQWRAVDADFRAKLAGARRG